MSAYSPAFIATKNAGGSGTGSITSSGAVSNLISSPLTIPSDTSYIVLSYLKVENSLTVNGNLGVL